MYKKTSLARSLALAFGSAVLMLSMPAPVLAQSNTAGSIYGTVSAAPGTVIQLENKATGAKRSVPGDANGRFNFASVPPGSYRLQLLRDGKVVETRDDIELSASQNQEISFANAGTTLEAVLVTGTRKVIDVTKTSSSTSFSAEKLAALPVAKNVTAVVLLAPNTTAADSRYSGGSSFAGGAASENASYINGFPVTNPLTQLGASELPFGAIQELQVLTGGMGAEFGRSVGGVVNIITKSGSNRWEGGVMMSVEPAGLRGKSVNLDYPTTGAAVNATTDGKLRRFRADDSLSKTEVGAYVGGPLIKDKLFLFIAAQQNDNKFSRVRSNNLSTDNASVLKWGWTEDKDRSQRLFSKLDWNLSDEHRLELSAIRDNSTRDSTYSGYDYSTLSRVAGSPITLNYKNIAGETPDGGDVNILKYTGYLTPDLTVTALVGESRVKHSNGIAGADIYDPSKALFGVQFPAGTQAPGLNYFNPNPLVGSLMSGKDARDTIKSKRIDIEYQLGRHSLRAGIDDNKLASTAAGDFTAGGGTWAFRKAPNPSAVRLAGKTFDLLTGGAAPTVLQKQGFYVLRSLFDDLTDAYSDQSALYLEDRWQVNKQLLLTAGIRKEDYNNRNHFNEKFVDQKNQIAPRLAAAFDVNGDGSLKLFGSAGRYFIQIPTHLAVRGASPSTGTSQIFGYTGIDPTTGAPTGLNQVSEPRSANNELGQRKGRAPDHRHESEADLPGRNRPRLREGAAEGPGLRRPPDLPQAALDHRRLLRPDADRRLGRGQRCGQLALPRLQLRLNQPGREGRSRCGLRRRRQEIPPREPDTGRDGPAQGQAQLCGPGPVPGTRTAQRLVRQGQLHLVAQLRQHRGSDAVGCGADRCGGHADLGQRRCDDRRLRPPGQPPHPSAQGLWLLPVQRRVDRRRRCDLGLGSSHQLPEQLHDRPGTRRRLTVLSLPLLRGPDLAARRHRQSAHGTAPGSEPQLPAACAQGSGLEDRCVQCAEPATSHHCARRPQCAQLGGRRRCSQRHPRHRRRPRRQAHRLLRREVLRQDRGQALRPVRRLSKDWAPASALAEVGPKEGLETFLTPTEGLGACQRPG